MNDGKRQTDRLAEALALPILQGLWPPGRQLPDDATLCAEHGVSRTVIREAMRILGAKGLTVAKPRRGTRVASTENWAICDPQILHWLKLAGQDTALGDDALDIRLALEPGLAALAAARADMAANTALQSALRTLQTGPDKTNEAAFLAALYAAGGNRFALGLLPLALFHAETRSGHPPLPAYAALTAAIAQQNGMAARQAATQAVLNDEG